MNSRRQHIRRFLLVAFFLALPVTLNYYSPYLMTQGTAERVATFSLVLWLAILATAPVLGRSFCGWICPFNGLQQMSESVAVRPLRRVRFVPAVKYVMWGAWALAVAAIAVRFGGWTKFEPFYMTENGVSISEPGNLVTYFMLVGLTVAPLALGRRGFCRYLCPFGVWGIVGEKVGAALRVPRLRLVSDAESCTGCGSCSKACPMQLPVTEMVQSGRTRATECIMCETCVDTCPRGGVRLGFGRPGESFPGA